MSPENETVSTSEEDFIADLMKHHDHFVGSMQSRLLKLQVIVMFSNLKKKKSQFPIIIYLVWINRFKCNLVAMLFSQIAHILFAVHHTFVKHYE